MGMRVDGPWPLIQEIGVRHNIVGEEGGLRLDACWGSLRVILNMLPVIVLAELASLKYGKALH